MTPLPCAFTQFPITAEIFSPAKDVIIIFETSKAAIFIKGIASAGVMRSPFWIFQEIFDCERISLMRLRQPGMITTFIPLS